MPPDCAFVYLVGLRVAFFPSHVFKRHRGIDESELTGSAMQMATAFFNFLEAARRGNWGGFQDADPAMRARASELFLSYLWLYLDFVERRKAIERKRTLSALCVIHNARLLSSGDPRALARCAKAMASLMPSFVKVKLASDEDVYRQLVDHSPVPIPGYPGDPALTSIAVRPFDGDKPLTLGRLAYELLVDPSYKSTAAVDYFDLFDECSFFTLERDLVGPLPMLDYLMDMIDSIAKSVEDLRGDSIPLLSDEGALLDAFEAHAPLAPLLQPVFDTLLAMCIPPLFFSPKMIMSGPEFLFVKLSECGGSQLPLRNAFVDRATSLQCDWLQLTDPFPAPQTPEETGGLWVRTLRYLMWMRTSLEVEASNVRIGLLAPIIEQKLPGVHSFIQGALFQEWVSPESAASFSVWRAKCLAGCAGVEDAIRRGIVDVVVSPSELPTSSTSTVPQRHPARTLFPPYPPQIPVEGLPITLRFDRGRLSRIRSRVESAVTIAGLFRTVEHALNALDAASAPVRLHACYLGILGVCNNAPLPFLIEALCSVIRDELGLRLPALRSALQDTSSRLVGVSPHDCTAWVGHYFSVMSNSVTHALIPCPDITPRPSDLMHAYIVSLLSPTVTMFQNMFLVNFSTFRSLYTGVLLAEDLEEMSRPNHSSSSDEDVI
jgi:hypothetical protein